MNDWKRLVAHFRRELHRYFPDCPECNIGVHGMSDGPYSLDMTPDDGVTIIEFEQVVKKDDDYYTFRQKSNRRLITIPFMKD